MARAGPQDARLAEDVTYIGPTRTEELAGHGAKDEGDDAMSEMEFGSAKCECTKCGTVVPHMKRGVPCSQLKCQKCGAPMRGNQCKESD